MKFQISEINGSLEEMHAVTTQCLKDGVTDKRRTNVVTKAHLQIHWGKCGIRYLIATGEKNTVTRITAIGKLLLVFAVTHITGFFLLPISPF